jgi:hypothetical protein
VGWADLHCDDSIVDDGFFCKEVGSDGGFILCAELFVYLGRSVLRTDRDKVGLTYWFMRDVLPTLYNLLAQCRWDRMEVPTVTEDDDFEKSFPSWCGHGGCRQTL